MATDGLAAMTTAQFLDRGEAEGFKLGIHVVLYGLAMTCGLYNLGAWFTRREPHLIVNAGIYGALSAWELRQVEQHAANRS